MNHTHLLSSARNSFVAALLVLVLGVGTFFAFEPSIGHSQISDSFTVSQTITNEISFLVTAANATMVGSIAGLSGGYATGTTVISVNTNNTTGYSMTLRFATNTVAHTMVASSTSASSAYISDYTPAVANTPDLLWQDNASGGSAEFGYTVRASTTAEVASAFMHNGGTCGLGSTEADDRCWINPTTTPRTIINSTAPNGSSTTTIKFKVAVPNAPSPAIPSGTYVATGTLTATTNP